MGTQQKVLLTPYRGVEQSSLLQGLVKELEKRGCTVKKAVLTTLNGTDHTVFDLHIENPAAHPDHLLAKAHLEAFKKLKKDN